MSTNTLPDYVSPSDRAQAVWLVNSILAKGWTISVNDGEEWTVKKSKDAAEILPALASTDNDTLRVRDAAGAVVGSAWLIWGNGPGELVADSSCDQNADFDAIMEKAMEVGA